MNYRHIYHAGNFADVYKHIVLILVLNSLLKKDKPFCYVDTHAGIGRYNLASSEARKTKEFVLGVQYLLKNQDPKPLAVENYIRVVKETNPSSSLKYYPGSPRIARAFLRSQDRMILTELHPIDAKSLKQEFQHDKQVSVHLLDGYQALKAFLPPSPRRGMVLIDPPYENPNEFQDLLKGLQVALARWRTGIYLAWYPVKNRTEINAFFHRLKRTGIQNILVTEFNLYPDDSPLALNGSGLVIINPPWQLKKHLAEIMPWLLNELDKKKQGNYRLESIA
jgi:23S rRNA (adenine2030-N6)-methyltransferase